MTGSTPQDLACILLVEMLAEYLEGALPPSAAADVEAHLADREGCAICLEQMRATIRALGTVPVETLGEDACQALLTAFPRRP